MRNVAFLSYDWDYEVMSAYYQGMKECLDTVADVRLTIFNAYGSYTNYGPQPDALKVFSLCDRSAYDAFIIQGNRVWPPAMRQQVVDEVISLGKPVVSMNYQLEGACTVGTDNYAAMSALIERVLEDQGCTRPAFVNGLATSAEAVARARAFRDVCAERGITDSRFYQADWQMEEGVRVAKEMLEHRDDLPDVIFCCNDDIAVGVQETLQAQGVRVPDEVRVAGFDNRENSLRADPRITTVDRDYLGIGRTAMKTLLGLMDGAAPRPFVGSEARIILSASCGYFRTNEFNDDIAGSLYTLDHAFKRFYEVLMSFQPAVLEADSLPEILEECERRFAEIRCQDAYLTLNADYLTRGMSGGALPYGRESLLVAVCRQGDEGCGLHADEDHVYARFAATDVLPPDVFGDDNVYMVFALREGDTCIGTLVTAGVSPIMRYGFLTFMLALLSSSIESVQKKALLKTMNERLDDLYVHDQLTGLFNRFGLDRFGALAYEHLLRDFDEAQFIFVDVDDMKGINDACGHELGDQALRETAAIIGRATEGENAFAMRYGGDEFLLIARRDLTGKIEAGLAEERACGTAPYDLRLSMGAFRVSVDDRLTMREAIDRADARMYEIKRARKGARE